MQLLIPMLMATQHPIKSHEKKAKIKQILISGSSKMDKVKPKEILIEDSEEEENVTKVHK